MAARLLWLQIQFLVVVVLLPAGLGLETPQYSTVHKESDFEVRLYHDTVWMSAPSDHSSFHVATKLGFHSYQSILALLYPFGSDFLVRGWRSKNLNGMEGLQNNRVGENERIFHLLFQYLMGANLNSSRIRMTAPVLTSVVPGAGPLHSSAHFVRLYLPVKFQASPPVPLPELNLHLDRWPSHCIAVRSFSGYARDQNVVEEAEKLALSLSRSPWANSTNHPGSTAYSIAQYNNPFRVVGRVNEVWFDVDCKSNGLVEAF